jgi:hypothetical protein
MIKTVFFTATLLVADLAYGQNPSADLSVQVVKPGNGIGIPCARGPNYTGSIPAAAAKAGFTTCVVNSDFSMAQYQTLSNWLDCAGATTPTWFNVGYNAGVTPCSDYTIVTDTVHGNNQTVLDIAYTASDASIGPGTWMATKNGTNGGPLGYDFPIGAYYDLTFELLPANVNVFNTTSAKAICAGIGGSGTLYCELLDWFAVNVSPFQEIDFLETDVFGALYPNGVTSGYLYNSGISPAICLPYVWCARNDQWDNPDRNVQLLRHLRNLYRVRLRC